MAAVSLLFTNALSRHFGGLKAVEKVNFDIAEGEVHALIGPNGAGKTTFVSLLSGRIPPSSGTVTFLGEDITSEPAQVRVRKGIAYTFQITSIYPKLTVFDNVALASQNAMLREKGMFGGLNQAALRADVFAVLTKVGLQDCVEAIAGTLAYGHQRLLEIAMGLALRPKLLILDEPTQGLSDGEIDVFCALVKTISVETTILLIEHNMPVVMRLADRITVLNRGEVLAVGAPDEIRANEAVQAAYLGGV